MFGQISLPRGEWRRHCRRYAQSATMPIKGRLLRETRKAYLIATPIREAWVPKRLVTHDPDTGIFTMPAWLSAQKLLH